MSIFKIGSMGRANIEAVDSSRSGAIAAPHFDLLAKNHVRDTIATHWDKELLRRYDIGELRRLASWGDGSAYFEGERTNYLIWANDITGSGWGNANGARYADTIVDPSGDPVAGRFDGTAFGTSQAHNNLAVGFPDNTVGIASAFVRRVGTWGEGSWGQPVSVRTAIRGKDLTVVQSSAPVAYGEDETWLRLDGPAKLDVKTGTFQPQLQVKAAPSEDVWSMGVAFAQLEAGEFPSMPIETFGLATTRDEDDHVVPQAEIDPAFLTGASEIQCWPSISSADMAVRIAGSGTMNLFENAVSNYLSLNDSGSAVTARMRAGGTNTQTGSLVFGAGDLVRLRFNPSSGLLRCITPTQDIWATGTGAPWTAGPFRIGATYTGLAPFFGRIRPPFPIREV